MTRGSARLGVNEVFIACAVVVAVLTLNPVPDPDLGWHLAGGLWILETRHLPTVDPFGAQGNFWLCYSWLAEVLFAAAYRFGGVAGLCALEALLRAGMTAVIVIAVQSHDGGNRTVSQRGAEWLAIAITMVLVLPLTRLRPQVIGWMLFAILLILADRDRLRLRYLLPLSVLWANVHVFWIFVPVVVFFYGSLWPKHRELISRLRGAELAAACAAAGIVNPYGWAMFSGMRELIFNQSASNSLAFEMAPISAYEFLWVYCAVIVTVLVGVRRAAANERPALLATFVLFAALAAVHIRYLPLCALSAAPILGRSILPAWLRGAAGLLRRSPSVPAPAGAASDARYDRARVFVLAAIIWLAAVPFIARAAQLPDSHRELFAIAGRLAADPELGRARRVHVLSDANVGGWLELAFWLARPAGATESSFKAAMDNRGLVVGQDRFLEYDQLRQMSGDWPRILSRWGVEVAILPSRALIIEALMKEAPKSSATDAESTVSWAPLYASANWTVLVRHPLLFEGSA